ncbi:MAG: hypothetical protein N2578_05705 [Bdellovibrionaceae bacterium]|nr:hypothetical protein [Pseudobdellovibrionaceae bacterium]
MEKWWLFALSLFSFASFVFWLTGGQVQQIYPKGRAVVLGLTSVVWLLILREIWWKGSSSESFGFFLFTAAVQILSLTVFWWAYFSSPRGGAYRTVRHPILLAQMLAYFGSAIGLRSFLVVAAAIGAHWVYTWVAISSDRFFGEKNDPEWLSYFRRSGRFLPPLWNISGEGENS